MSSMFRIVRLSLPVLILTAVLVPAGVPLLPSQAQASTTLNTVGLTLVVNSTADPGSGACEISQCTLRAAITRANASSGLDTITFNIPGSGVPTIQVTSALPTITDPITLDGSTQTSGYVELDGSRAGTAVNGLTIQAGGSTLRGLVINRFSGDGIYIKGQGGNTLAGNIIGTDLSSRTGLGNAGSGIVIDNIPNNTIGGTSSTAGNVLSGNGRAGLFVFDEGAAGNVIQGNLIGTDRTGLMPLGNEDDGILLLYAAGNTIGGLMPEARNVIAGNRGSGVHLYQTQAPGNTVQGNYIGTDMTGATALGNAFEGVLLVDASDNTIGGTTPGAGNLISGNSLNGVRVVGSTADARRNVVQGNRVGTDVTGRQPLGNRQDGVHLNEAVETVVGGVESGAANTIAFNGGRGVHVLSGTGNALRRNAIFSNDNTGIDLGDEGVTVNDLRDTDQGPNNLQNFPVLTSASPNSGGASLLGTLDSVPTTRFLLEFFSNSACDPTGFGEGETFLNSVEVTTDANGRATFTVSVPIGEFIGQALTATTTDPSGNTSEFSRCLALPGASTITPTATATPTASLTPTPSATPTATITPADHHAYLPLIMKRATP